MLVNVEVTPECVARKVRDNPCHHPISAALCGKLRENVVVLTFPRNAYFSFRYHDVSKQVAMPPAAVEFFRAYDGQQAFSPIAFPIDIPDEFLRPEVLERQRG